MPPELENEGQHVQTVFPPDDALGGPGYFAFNPLAHMTEAHALATPASRARLEAEWGAHWDASKGVLLEKSPSNLLRARFLQALWPDCHFVFIVRHPLAHAYASAAWGTAHAGKGALAPDAVADFVEHWLHAHALLKARARAIRRAIRRAILARNSARTATARRPARLAAQADLPHLRNVTLVHLEDFAADPQPAVDAIYGALGLPSCAVPEGKVTKDVNAKYAREWRREASALRERIASMEPAMRAMQYDLSGTFRPLGPPLAPAALPNGHAHGHANGHASLKRASPTEAPTEPIENPSVDGLKRASPTERTPERRPEKRTRAAAAGPPRRPLILTLGTRGDVQPFLPLASAMRDAGWAPLVVTLGPYQSLVEAAGVPFAPLVPDTAVSTPKVDDATEGFFLEGIAAFYEVRRHAPPHKPARHRHTPPLPPRSPPRLPRLPPSGARRRDGGADRRSRALAQGRRHRRRLAHLHAQMAAHPPPPAHPRAPRAVRRRRRPLGGRGARVRRRPLAVDPTLVRLCERREGGGRHPRRGSHHRGARHARGAPVT